MDKNVALDVSYTFLDYALCSNEESRAVGSIAQLGPPNAWNVSVLNNPRFDRVPHLGCLKKFFFTFLFFHEELVGRRAPGTSHFAVDSVLFADIFIGNGFLCVTTGFFERHH